MFHMYVPSGFTVMSTLFPILFSLTFLLIFGMIIFAIVRGVRQWNNNNKQPVLIVDALVVTKRTEVSHRHRSNDYYASSSTNYYVTFEVESGDRMEFNVSGNDYGVLAEKDFGRLKFQGTRYLGFERISRQN